MNGLMMQQPLLISSLLKHAERHHGEQEVVSRRVEGDIHRETYRELAVRARRMAKALAALGVRSGQRVATLAWNGHRHMELYYAVSGSGAVLHTLNPRLHPDQVVYIADHAEDQILFFDLSFLPLIEAIAPRVKTIKRFIAMTDRAHMPKDTKIPNRSNIRECKDIANASEVIVIGFEPDKDIPVSNGPEIVAGTKCLLVDKCKNGPRGIKFPMFWNDISASFSAVENNDHYHWLKTDLNEKRERLQQEMRERREAEERRKNGRENG